MAAMQQRKELPLSVAGVILPSGLIRYSPTGPGRCGSAASRAAITRQFGGVALLRLRFRYVSKAPLFVIALLKLRSKKQSPAWIPRSWLTHAKVVAAAFSLRI